MTTESFYHASDAGVKAEISAVVERRRQATLCQRLVKNTMAIGAFCSCS